LTIKSKVKEKIDPRAIPLILLLSITEFKLLVIGRTFFPVTERDSWLAVLLGGILVILGTYFLLRLMKRFPNKNFFQYLPQIWGKPLSIIITLGYLLFWASYLVLLFDNISEVNRIFFLEKTPLLLPVFLLAIAAVWLVAYGFAVITRFIQIISPLYIIPLMVVLALAIDKIEIHHFFPILDNGMLPVIKGAILFAGHFHGLELILFLTPFLKDTRQAFKPTLIGVAVFNFFALIAVILIIGILGIKNTNEVLWPGFTVLSLIEIPGLPAERFELLLTLPLLITAFVTISITLYLLSYGIVQLFNIARKKIVIYITAFFAVLAILLIPIFSWGIVLRDSHIYAALVFVYFLPFLTLLLAVLRKKGS
jgi:spore germination protein (amino acid permease)